MTAQVLQSDRLTLRPLSAKDGAFVAALISDPRVRRYLGGPVPVAEQPATVERYLAEAWIWCVQPRGSTGAVGLMSLSPHHDGADTELSFQMMPGVWGRGLASEGAARLCRHGLTDLALPRVLAETQAANAPARRLLNRIGMPEVRRTQRFGAVQVIHATPTHP
ncbi:GNAT family N-acetyltransferase [Jannaschia pohangensis]|uniref:Acetyltransferase (GNAT) domain-containing protein n=1 Tax=Jannaschia pohangensis TaxID=390807 RepID=A0A1I3M9N0_9RHOB|nr:GNAT family N-acetyltransferase [Jannaschia pohangensis]SFI93683.1 Acetyltransferase (GNAT) domain-containing protein [Jannaschia pohangensis]